MRLALAHCRCASGGKSWRGLSCGVACFSDGASSLRHGLPRRPDIADVSDFPPLAGRGLKRVVRTVPLRPWIDLLAALIGGRWFRHRRGNGQACFCGDVSQASGSQVGRAHPMLQRGKDVRDGASADVHRFWHGCEPSLNPLQNSRGRPAGNARSANLRTCPKKPNSPWPETDWNGGRPQIGRPADFKSESPTGLHRHLHGD
jgi:hypothetical protein